MLISDAHLGKITHFRKAGIGVPSNASTGNYKRLRHLLDKYVPESLIFLGDLFHSTYNHEWLFFSELRKTYSHVSFELILGNHDILDSERYTDAELKISSEKHIGPFLLTHHPCIHKELFNLCGHIHPAIRIRGKGRQSIRIPCFYFTENQGVLPAFGTFTGSHLLKLQNANRVFGIADNSVIKIH